MIPDWLDYSTYENTAIAMLRGLEGLSANWGELLASAQVCVGFFQEHPVESLELLYEETYILPLIAAARILDSASQDATRVELEDRLHIAAQAAIAFGMYGIFPSARAVIDRAFTHEAGFSASIAVAIATASPSHYREMLRYCRPETFERNFLELLGRYLYTGDTTSIPAVRQSFIDCILAADTAFEGSLLRSARVCLEHIFQLSVARTVGCFSDNYPDHYVQQLIDSGVRVLLPTQYKAIVKHGICENVDNTIIAIPTSTGKTLLGELSLLSALGKAPGLVCYLAPYVALGRQVAQSIQNHVPPNVRIRRMIGGYKEIDQLDPTTNAEVVVATPERLDVLLRTAPELLSHLKCIVCDEAHSIENSVRGVRLEGILTRLRMLQDSGYAFKIVLLSAVMPGYGALADWMGAPPENIVSDSWKPTARRIAHWSQGGRLHWYVGSDPIRRAGTKPTSAVGSWQLPWPETDFYPARHYGQQQSQLPLVHKNIAYLAQALYDRFEGPILCACSTKEGTRRVAMQTAKRFPEQEPIPKHTAAAIARIQSHYRFLSPLAEALSRGIAYHNSAVPHEVRQLIEDAIQARELRVVAATTTLAEGVDLPFRFTILVDWLMWDAGEQRPISPMLFKNVSGRCGRAGIFTEGDTVIFDNPVGEGAFTEANARRLYQRDIFFSESNDQVGSMLKQLLDAGLRTSESQPSLAALASQVLASIPENPNENDLAQKFLESSYFHHRYGYESRAADLINGIIASLLDEQEEALARANSPLHLTEFGEACNDTGFSPHSCRVIFQFLRRNTIEGELVDIVATLLRELASLPEQTRSDIRKALSDKRSRFCVKQDDFELVARMWLEGNTPDEIFAILPAVSRSKRKPGVQVWLAGSPDESTWDGTFDKFVDFTNAVFEGYLPWLFRACGRLGDYIGTPQSDLPWRDWADMIEAGVSNKWAVNAIRNNAPGSRRAMNIVGKDWPLEYSSQEDELGVTFLKNVAIAQHVSALIDDVIERCGGEDSPLGQDVFALKTWLWMQAGLVPRRPQKRI